MVEIFQFKGFNLEFRIKINWILIIQQFQRSIKRKIINKDFNN